MSENCELRRGLRRREKNATDEGAGHFEKPAPDARAAPPEAHESLISRETVAEVLLTGLSFSLLLRDAGFSIHYLNLSGGDCGSMTTGPEETRAIREREGGGGDSRGDRPREPRVGPLHLVRGAAAATARGRGAQGAAADRAHPLARGLHGRPYEHRPAGCHGRLCPRHAQLRDRSADRARHGRRGPLSRDASRPLRRAAAASRAKTCSSIRPACRA